MERLSLIISIAAILWSLITYFVHDRKIKQQEARINEYQLEKIKNEEEENKKALIRGDVLRKDKGLHMLKISNQGKAIAKNVNMKISDPQVIEIYDNKMPCEFMHPQDCIELRFYIVKTPVTTVKITFTWDDDFKSGNERTQILLPL